MTAKAPAVSVVVPAHDVERFIADAVRSVCEQTFGDLECIVVDDGSTDGTAAAALAAGDARVRVVRQANAGVSAARNRGIGEARAPLVALLDADDVWLPPKLALQVERFSERPDLGLLATGYLIVDEALRPINAVIHDPGPVDLAQLLMLESTGLAVGLTAMVRTDLARSTGFRSLYSTSADLDFALRVGERAPVEVLAEPLGLYRQHPNQMHLDLDAFEHDVLALFDTWMPADGPATRARRRGIANLRTRIALYEAYRHHWRAAVRHAVRAGAARPDRLLAMPASIAMARVRRRRALRRGV